MITRDIMELQFESRWDMLPEEIKDLIIHFCRCMTGSPTAELIKETMWYGWKEKYTRKPNVVSKWVPSTIKEVAKYNACSAICIAFPMQTDVGETDNKYTYAKYYAIY